MNIKPLRRAVLGELERFGPSTDLRDRYVALIHGLNAPFADHILKMSDWLIYVFFGRLMRLIVADKSARIIDWGGQYGQVTRLLMELGFQDVHNYLLHVPPHYEAFEKAFGLSTIYGQDPNRLEMADHSAAVLISSGVLEHVIEDGRGREEAVLMEIRRVLKPGGLFFIWNLPTALGTSELLAALVGRKHHRRRYWRRTILKLLHEAGFDVLFVDKHKLLPGSLLNRLGRLTDPVKAFKGDDLLSRLPFLSLFARDWAVLARKPLRGPD